MIDFTQKEPTPDGEINLIQSQSPDAGSIPALTFGDDLIPCNLLIQQLQEFQLLPKLIEEIVLNEVLERTALESGIDLDYSSAEFEELYTQIEQSRSCQGMNPHQLTAITERELK